MNKILISPIATSVDYHLSLQKNSIFHIANPRTTDIRSVSVRHEGLNGKIERLQGSIRDREVVMRGMDHKESAQELMEALRIYHNYIKAHQGLDGKTPAEASGIKIDDSKNKWMALIRNASI